MVTKDNVNIYLHQRISKFISKDNILDILDKVYKVLVSKSNTNFGSGHPRVYVAHLLSITLSMHSFNLSSISSCCACSSTASPPEKSSRRKEKRSKLYQTSQTQNLEFLQPQNKEDQGQKSGLNGAGRTAKRILYPSSSTSFLFHTLV